MGDTYGFFEDAETMIRDRQGYVHDGMYCNCMACPYIVEDVDGEMACYCDQYYQCKDDQTN